MTQLQAIKWFADFVADEPVIVAPTGEWSMLLYDRHPRLTIPFDLDAKDEDDKLFRIDFIQRCPMGRGFADVTLSILHEIGHHFHREEYIFMTNIKEYNEAKGSDHFKFPCEIVATDWAIEWLQDPLHRKVAKEFERDFFGRA